MEKLRMIDGIRLSPHTEEFMGREERARMALSTFLTKEGVYKLLDMGYTKAPASTKHHGAYIGGLFDHCWYMSRILGILTENLNLVWGRKDSPVVISYMHDLCKIDAYKCVPDGDSVRFEHNEYDVFKGFEGHGNKSIQILDQLNLFEMTEEERNCIRYHMGAYDTADIEIMSSIAKKYPNLYFVQLADCIASQIMGV